MTDRTELIESTLDGLAEGVAILGLEDELVFWNRAAASFTGFTGVELLTRAIPRSLGSLLAVESVQPGGERERGGLVHLRHKLGHELQAMRRFLVLRDGLGERIGSAVVFHPAEMLDALPHGEAANEAAGRSQAELEERLAGEFEDCAGGGMPFGVLWIAVDQAERLHSTHGAGACEAMLGKVVNMLAQGLRPTEELGRWGRDEFLVISHERTAEMLAAHGQVLAGIARTADFRWWGDRVTLTVSVGAAQSVAGESLRRLLERAQEAMVMSIQAGGNRVTPAREGQACLPS